MRPLAEAATALYGAWRLACRDPGGLRYMDTSMAGARRTKPAALLSQPATNPHILILHSN